MEIFNILDYKTFKIITNIRLNKKIYNINKKLAHSNI